MVVATDRAPGERRRGASGFRADLHAFRGFAVAAIVAAHCTFKLLGAHGGEDRGSPGRIAILAIDQTVFHGSTLFFALISGLLFAQVLAGRGWGAFFRSKLLHVALPYAFVSLLYLGLNSAFNLDPKRLGEGSFVERWLEALPVGTAFFHLWYMPVLFVLFALTPLAWALLRRPAARPLVIAIVLAPLVVSRVWGEWTWATPAYFFGAYVAGMWAGMDYPATLRLVARHRTVLVVMAVLATVVLLALNALGISMAGPVDLRESVGYVQKLAVAALVLLALDRVRERPPRLLMQLGDLAFPIYFLHMIPISFLGLWLAGLASAPLPAWQIALGAILLFVLGLAATWALARLLQSVLGRAGRYLIGAGEARPVARLAPA
jgi:peptidoglycan/LPS O-acetylase OafA/YrhL